MAKYYRDRSRRDKFYLVSAAGSGEEAKIIRDISFDEGAHLVRTERAEFVADEDGAVVGFQLVVVRGVPVRYRGFPSPFCANLAEAPRQSCRAISRSELMLILSTDSKAAGYVKEERLAEKIRKGWFASAGERAHIKLELYPATR